jgi:hypothetical protein
MATALRLLGPFSDVTFRRMTALRDERSFHSRPFHESRASAQKRPRQFWTYSVAAQAELS